MPKLRKASARSTSPRIPMPDCPAVAARSLSRSQKYIEYRDEHTTIERKAPTAVDRVVFNAKRFAFNNDHAEPVFFDRARAHLFEVSEKVVPFITRAAECTSPRTVDELGIPLYVASWMVRKEILQYAS